jgi:hypothetical protein
MTKLAGWTSLGLVAGCAAALGLAGCDSQKTQDDATAAKAKYTIGFSQCTVKERGAFVQPRLPSRANH